MPRCYSAILPEKIYVRFRCRRCSGSASGTVPLYYLRVHDTKDFNENLNGHPGTKIFHSTAIALFPAGSDAPTNASALADLTTQIAFDFINWFSESYDESYAQVISPIIDGTIDTISWEYHHDKVITRRYSIPYNSDSEILMHHDPANSGCADSAGVVVTQTPCIYFYGPPGTCVSGKPNLTRYKVCLVGGELIQEYVSTDIVQ